MTDVQDTVAWLKRTGRKSVRDSLPTVRDCQPNTLSAFGSAC